MAGDGQVTFGQTVVKQRARKIRRLYNDRILAGCAGSAADSFALFARFESKLEQYRGNLERSAVAAVCEVNALVPGGDHIVVLADIHRVNVREDANPLVYHRRRMVAVDSLAREPVNGAFR